MALQKQMIFNNGLSLNTTYIYVYSLAYNTIDNSYVTLHTCINKESKHIYSPISYETHIVPLDINSNLNFIAQAYIFLKSLPEFSGATDV